MTDVEVYEGHQPVLSAEMAELARRAVEQEKESLAPRTLDAYRKDWAAFCRWCEAHGFVELPATVDTVRLFIAEQAETKRPSTVYRQLAAVKLQHDLAGHASPTVHKKVSKQMLGFVRADARHRAALGQPTQRRAKAATVEIMRRLVARLDRERVIGKRDAALILLGFAGGFRRSELVALRWGDVDDAPGGLEVTVRLSKTDQEGRGLVKNIMRGSDPDTCPVRAVETWRSVLGPPAKSDPVFRGVDRHGNVRASKMDAGSVARIVKRACAAAGLDEAGFSGHSLRRGMATTAARNGVHDRHIARLGGWEDGSKVLARYIDDGRSWNDTASGKLGL